MAVEEMEKSAASDNPNPNNTDNNNRPQTEDDEPEEGEIVGSDGDPPPEKPLAEETHQLEHSWTFWFDDLAGKANQVDWGSSIRPIYTFSTVEQFWSVYNNIRHPSKLVVGTDFYCFKHEIKPKWEDPVCAKGGKWSVNFHRGKSDTAWLYTLLAMIGEQFDHGDEICGAVINIRPKQDKIGLWTKTALNESAQMSIGRQWKEFLDYNGTIGFIVHEDAKKHERSAKNTYSL